MPPSEGTRSSAVFDYLSPPVREALEHRGFANPTAPQQAAIPPLARGEDALVIAPTGTGKTETAMLPVFDAIVKRDPQYGFSALYITPLRALNRDMLDRLSWWGETLGVRVAVRHGDTTRYERQKQANDPPDVLIITPETLQAILTGEKLRLALEDVHHVIVDEVHELAGSKRGAQLSIGLERLAELAGSFQRIGLSATVGDPHEVGAFLTGGGQPELIEIHAGARLDITVHNPPITAEDETLAAELATEPAIASHVRAILDLVDTHESTLIFVNTRQTAEAMGARFKALGAAIGVHHGSLSKDARITVEDQFKAGDLDALLCTSSMELGIDIGHVDHVVQYGSPREVTRLLQRVGRAGHRAETTSRGTIISRNPDDTLEALAIARRALDGLVEPAHLHHGSLDVVANQVAGLVMDYGELSARRAYEVVTRAYPFREVTEDTFKEVVREVAANRIVWLDEDDDRISKRNGTWQYFYANLSMIPDEETYTVNDLATSRQVGTLDERFVVNFAEPGASFIQQGEMWRIVHIDEDDGTIDVSPVEDPAGEIPSWIGEEIPVPYGVAQEVGDIRRTVAEAVESGRATDELAEELADRYPGDEATIAKALVPIADHVEAGFTVPTDRRIVIEKAASTVVVNACFGHRVNDTLGRLASALIGQATGSSVGMDVDPYRIELEVSPRATSQDVAGVFTDTDPDHVAPLIELSLKRSDALGFRLAQVAEVFGRLRPWQGDSGLTGHRLRAALEGTPVYDEAVRAVFHDELDVDQTRDVLSAVQGGEIPVVEIADRTPIGMAGESTGRELLTPENADASVIESVRNRIMDDRVRLVCLHCKEWVHETRVKRAPDKPECLLCGSTRVAALSPWADEVVEAVRAREKTPDQDRMTRRAHRNASLVQSHGRKAVIALSGRGVGPTTAARIINRWRENEDEFYRDILKREREYARTRSFWD